MIIITPQDLFEQAKSRDLITLKCKKCNKLFNLTKHRVQTNIKRKSGHYCSVKCAWEDSKTGKYINCKQCDKLFYKTFAQLKKYTNNFCSQSCSATYNNTHKTKGYRRSKLELWLEIELPKHYPNIEFHFCRKDAINSELDIYIPSLKLAFELNGIFHYEPIYGEKTLLKIQNNDARKFQACLEKQIEFCIIDVSTYMHHKPEKAQKYLTIIKNIIDSKLNQEKSN